MEDLFRELRQQKSSERKGPPEMSFADALLGGRPFFLAPKSKLESEKASLKPGPTPEQKVETQSQEASTEQEKTLQSLKKFTQKMQEDEGRSKLSFPGGKIVTKSEGQAQKIELDFAAPKGWDSIEKRELVGQVFNEALLAETFFLGEQQVQEQTLLLDKMIAAMKRPDKSAARFPLAHKETDTKESDADADKALYESIACHIYLTKPRVVIPMGVRAVSLLFGKKSRLSQLRGKFYPLEIVFSDSSSYKTQVAPIFHPEYLLANPSMKKTAWEDLQKIMRFLDS